jgi:DNA primase
MMTEGLSFPEAVERLAGEAGLPLPTISRAEEARDERRKTLNDVMELAAKFFEATLAARAGAKARGYLADRGLDPATQVRFRLGYAPAERFALKEHLGKEGISTPDMIEAGLLVAGDDIPVPYDRFRDRVMFPITDLRGRVIAFGGRALEKDAQAKYLNSPETPLFHKGGTLYNIAAARAAAHKGAPVIAVEGYVDVIAMVTRVSGDGGAAQHHAHRRPVVHLEDGGRADAPASTATAGRRRLSRRRSGLAADQGRQEPEVRQSAGRARP